MILFYLPAALTTHEHVRATVAYGAAGATVAYGAAGATVTYGAAGATVAYGGAGPRARTARPLCFDSWCSFLGLG